MKINKERNMISVLTGVLVMGLSLSASANFFVDYQGLEHKKITSEELRRLNGAPDGYRILTDKTYGLVHQIGKGTAFTSNSFGTDMTIKDAVSMIMPEKWIAYIDENVEKPSLVDWQANNNDWTDVLGKIGANYGYRFVVDWDQKLLQVTLDQNYTAPDYNDPIALKDPDSGRTLFVYSAKPISQGGVILVNGKTIPVKVEN
tara:strand:+ start:9989 stop:10594 length:606 start_codon:yes stop_codon:yes gene_type:complete